MMKEVPTNYFGGSKPEPYFALRMEQIENGYLVIVDTDGGCQKFYAKDEKAAASMMEEVMTEHKKGGGKGESEKDDD